MPDAFSLTVAQGKAAVSAHMNAEIELALEDAKYREYLVGAANRATDEHMKLYYKTLFAEVRRRENALAHLASAPLKLAESQPRKRCSK